MYDVSEETMIVVWLWIHWTYGQFSKIFFRFKIEKYFPLKYIRFKNITKIKRKHIFPEKNFIENKDSNNKWNGNLSFLFRKKPLQSSLLSGCQHWWWWWWETQESQKKFLFYYENNGYKWEKICSFFSSHQLMIYGICFLKQQQ